MCENNGFSPIPLNWKFKHIYNFFFHIQKFFFQFTYTRHVYYYKNLIYTMSEDHTKLIGNVLVIYCYKLISCRSTQSCWSSLTAISSSDASSLGRNFFCHQLNFQELLVVPVNHIVFIFTFRVVQVHSLENLSSFNILLVSRQ